MPRVHLLELEDQPWFPAILRDGGTAFLAFAERMSGHGRGMAEPLVRALEATGATHLVDLCSGGGGPAAVMVDELARRGHEVTVTLTDLYPNPEAFAWSAALAPGRVTGLPSPVDARAVPRELVGLRTIFNAFHHFRPDDARRVLQNAVDAGQPVAVFEVVSREAPMLLGLLGAPITATLSFPLWRPFRWAWLPFILLPVLQLFILWDGLVSWLRIYSEPELRALAASLDAPGWTWDIGKVRHGDTPLHGTFLVGVPPR